MDGVAMTVRGLELELNEFLATTEVCRWEVEALQK